MWKAEPLKSLAIEKMGQEGYEKAEKVLGTLAEKV